MNDYRASTAWGLWQVHQPSCAWVGEYVVPRSYAAIMAKIRRRYGPDAWRYLKPDADGLVPRPTLERR